jgi:signal transduction histidine kinase
MIQQGPVPSTGRSIGEKGERRNAPDLLTCVLEAFPIGIGLFTLADGEFRFQGGNREFARVLKLERTPASGQPLGEIFVLGERESVRQLFQQVIKKKVPQSYFAPQDTEQGRHQIWNIDAYPVFMAGRLTHVMVLAEQSEQGFDLRQRQQVETNRLRERADELAELEKAKSEFLRLASHELRGPAAMLGGYLAMMEDEALGPIPERLRPVLPLLKAKAAQINMLASAMVEAARLEDRRLQLKRKRVDLREVARRIIDNAAAGITSKHRLQFEEQAVGPVMVLADVMRLEIIIGNLIDNALKYSPEGGDITVQLSTVGQQAFLKVRDLGIGIAPEDMKRLFIRFNRLAPQADVPGTGLGLYLARELARLHGGDIVASSSLGEGSEFTLSLPLESSKN